MEAVCSSCGEFFGLATQEEVANLRQTIQTLEDNLASLEARASAPPASS